MRRAESIAAALAVAAVLSSGARAQVAPPTPPVASESASAVPLFGHGATGGRLYQNTDSMRPSVWRGDFVSGHAWSGAADETLRGRIIVFVNPRPPGADWISRVIALPGERIQVRGGAVYIDGRLMPRERIEDLAMPELAGRPAARYRQFVETLPNDYRYRVAQSEDPERSSDRAEVTVPADHVFVLSDNRDNAIDSRLPSLMGPVPVANVRAIVTEIAFSFDPGLPILERGAIALFVASPPAWFPPRTAEDWRQAEEWRNANPLARQLRLERSQLAVDRF